MPLIQLSGFEATASLDEVGTVLTVGDGIVRAYGLSNAQYGELVQFEGGLEGIVLNLEEDNVGIVLLGASKVVKEGSTVKRTGRIASINVGEGIVGRVVDTLAHQLMVKDQLKVMFTKCRWKEKHLVLSFVSPKLSHFKQGLNLLMP